MTVYLGVMLSYHSVSLSPPACIVGSVGGSVAGTTADARIRRFIPRLGCVVTALGTASLYFSWQAHRELMATKATELKTLEATLETTDRDSISIVTLFHCILTISG